MKVNTRILIVLLGAIGDVTRALAIARALRIEGGFHVSWLVETKSAAMVRMCPDVDTVIEFERERGVFGLIAVIKKLRAQKFDVTLDLQRHAKSGIFSLLSGAPRRLGWNPKNTKEMNHWCNTEFIAPWNIDSSTPTTSKLQAYLSFLTLLGVQVPKKPEWRLDENRLLSGEAIVENITDQKSIGIVLSSSWESKDWLGCEPLARKLLTTYSDQIVLFGDSKREQLAKVIVAHNPSRIHSTVGQLDLAGLVRGLRACKFVIGPDSGPGHICAALGVPYVGLFGPTDPAITAPEGNAHLALQGIVGCGPCYRRICPGLGTICMRLISPAAVMDKLEAISSSSRSSI